MKPNQPTGDDQPVRKVLREWVVDPALPPRFEEHVWQRIARREAQVTANPWTFLVHWIQNALSRSTVAASYVALLLFLGLTVGYWQAQKMNWRLTQAARDSYVQVVDPYRTPR